MHTNYRYLPLNGLVLLPVALVTVLADLLGLFEGGLSAISSFIYRKSVTNYYIIIINYLIKQIEPNNLHNHKY